MKNISTSARINSYSLRKLIYNSDDFDDFIKTKKKIKQKKKKINKKKEKSRFDLKNLDFSCSSQSVPSFGSKKYLKNLNLKIKGKKNENKGKIGELSSLSYNIFQLGSNTSRYHLLSSSNRQYPYFPLDCIDRSSLEPSRIKSKNRTKFLINRIKNRYELGKVSKQFKPNSNYSKDSSRIQFISLKKYKRKIIGF